MHPQFNSHLHNPNNNQLQFNGANGSAPQQVMRSQGNFRPNSMQVLPQFQMGMLNNPQLAMPPFTNPNTYFAPPQFFPFPQGSLQNINATGLPQLYGNNAINPALFLPNGQVNVPNLVQNVNQLLQMQMPNYGPPNSGFVNAQLGVGNGNGVVQQSADGNGLMNVNHNPAVNKDFGSSQAQGNQNVFSPGGGKSQSKAGPANRVNDRNNSWRKPHNNNFNGNHKHDASQRGFGKRQFNQQHNTPGNFKFNKENRGKGNKNMGPKNFTLANSSEQTQVGEKRSLVLNYTEQEIRQWREERRKNHPSNGYVDKKLKENPTQPEVKDEVSKIRRQQLKEILAKQAELGCEVAEIPSSYLSDSELQTDGRQQKPKKRERFNKFDKKKGKFNQKRSDSANLPNQNDRFAKRQRITNQKEPSLLEKLLSSDIKRDKMHLLQVFRFMLTNSFFENMPEIPLKYPEVIVKELECELVEEKSQVVKGDNTCDNSATINVENQMVCNGEFDQTERKEEDESEEDGEIMD